MGNFSEVYMKYTLIEATFEVYVILNKDFSTKYIRSILKFTEVDLK